jgi:hypothetical protein
MKRSLFLSFTSVGLLMLMSQTVVSARYDPTLKVGREDSSPKRAEMLGRIKRSHIAPGVREKMFNSYRLTGCMHLNQIELAKNNGKLKPDCLREETGVLQPSLSYVSIVIGGGRITELIDTGQKKGWHLSRTSVATLRGMPANVSELPKLKYDAISENTQHSLLAFLGLLNSGDLLKTSDLLVSSTQSGVVVAWRTGDSLNEFFFNKKTFLCEKQVRTIPAGVTVFLYSNYRKVANVMLPYTIVLLTPEGKAKATRQVDKWNLGAAWPADYFSPQKINFLD